MKKLLLPVIALTLVACDRNDNPNTTTSTQRTTTQDVDNTGINARDRNTLNKTSGNQSESEEDRTITQKIRQAIMADDSLSTNAKNIKIITLNGVVTLRGPVASLKEKDIIAKKVANVPGIIKVDNQLDVTRDNY